MKKILIAVLVLTFIITGSLMSFADNINETLILNEEIDEIAILLSGNYDYTISNNGSTTTYTITDTTFIENYRQKDVNGQYPSQTVIVLYNDIQTFNNVSNRLTVSNDENLIQPLGLFSTKYDVRNIVDSNGLYTIKNGAYKSYIMQGPTLFNMGETEESGAVFTSSVTAGAKGIVEAKVGVSFSSNYAWAWSATYNVPDGETWTFNIFTVYKKKSFEVWKEPLFSSTWELLTAVDVYTPQGGAVFYDVYPSN